MAVQTTRWSPDTCDCVIEYQWDNAVAQAIRTHTPSTVVVRCPAHSSLASLATHFAALMDENPRKNRILAQLATQYVELTTTDASGNVVLKAGAVTWAYDANRVLQVTAPALTVAKKTQAQTWCDTNLGAGKVKVN